MSICTDSQKLFSINNFYIFLISHSPAIYQYQTVCSSTKMNGIRVRDERRYTLISDDLKIIKNY